MTNKCKHRRLAFGMGGLYIQCTDCKKHWMAVVDGDIKDTERSQDRLFTKDLRIDPELLELQS